MKAKKLISTFAKTDLSDASRWYEAKQNGLGKRFLDEMKEAFDIICKNPAGFQIRYDENRVFFTKIFPYSIHYQYIANKNKVLIKAVFHTARSPQIWKQRIF